MTSALYCCTIKIAMIILLLKIAIASYQFCLVQRYKAGVNVISDACSVLLLCVRTNSIEFLVSRLLIQFLYLIFSLLV